ncbi:MAG: GNAT family N-acetyltransferase [Flavobacterium sp.]|nr:GNAT family N-acetyltransferase [Aeromicrobium sp.]
MNGPDLAAVYSDPDVARHIGAERLTFDETVAQVGRFVEVWQKWGYGQAAVIEKATNAFIGRVGLHPWTDWNEVELGWVIARSHQRKGFATEAGRVWIDWASEHLPDDYLISVIHPDNTASISTAIKLGFDFARDDETPWNPVVVYRRRLGAH